MKKLMFMAAFSAVLGFTSCSSDDDGGDDNCESCGSGAVSITICDNGNGTYSVNGDDTEIPIPEDSSFEEIVELSCSAISI